MVKMPGHLKLVAREQLVSCEIAKMTYFFLYTVA